MKADGFVQIQGGELHYELEGSGPALVFTHGLGGNERSWFQQIPAFADKYTCITFSHRGFTPSRDETGAPRPEFFAEDMRRLLDHLGISRAALVAQSMGGWTAMEFALSAPTRVWAMVLAGTTGTLADPQIASLQATGADTAVAALRELGIHPAAGRRMAEGQPVLHKLFREIDRSSGDWDRDEVRRRLDAMRVRSIDELRRINCPRLGIVGGEDVVCPPSNVALLRECGLVGELAVVPRSGHSVYFERPAVFNRILKQFLDRR